jgi:hypothetical protein
MESVFLEDVTEVKKLPSEGVLAHFHLQPDRDQGSIWMSLPGVPQEFCTAYNVSMDAEPAENYPDEWCESPFVSFAEEYDDT